MSHTTQGERLVRITLEMYLLRVVGLAISFLSNIMLARMLGPAGKGVLTVALTWAGIVGGVLIAGMGSSLVYELGRNPSLFRRLSHGSLWFTCAAAIIGIPALYFLTPTAAGMRTHPMLFGSTGALLLTTLIMGLFTALFTGIGRVVLTGRANIAALLLYCALLASLYFSGYAQTAHVLVILIITQGAVCVFLIWRALREPPPATGIAPPPVWRDFWAYTGRAYAINVGGILHLHAVLMVLTATTGAATIGIYSVAQNFADVPALLPIVLSSVLFPEIARAPRAEAAIRIALMSRCALLIGGLFAGAIALAAAALITPVFGAAFRHAIPMVAILTLGTWAFTGSTLFAVYFSGTGRQTFPLLASWLGLVIGGGAALWLTPSMGGLGAALAMTFSRIRVLFFLLTAFLRDSGFAPREALFIQHGDWKAMIRILKSLASRARDFSGRLGSIITHEPTGGL
jgi:O-antigen/teichoic acid export membrane protein